MRLGRHSETTRALQKYMLENKTKRGEGRPDPSLRGALQAWAMGDQHISSRDVDEHIATLKQCKIISEDSVKALCEKAKEILMEESNVHHVPIPAVVVSASAARQWADERLPQTACDRLSLFSLHAVRGGLLESQNRRAAVTVYVRLLLLSGW